MTAPHLLVPLFIEQALSGKNSFYNFLNFYNNTPNYKKQPLSRLFQIFFSPIKPLTPGPKNLPLYQSLKVRQGHIMT